MHVLVTGGTGFIGTHLIKELVKQGHKVVNYDIRKPENPICEYMFGNIADLPTNLHNLFKLKEFDAVYHLAAQTSVPNSVQNPHLDARVNIIGTMNVLEMCQKFNAKLIFASTAASYGNPAHLPIREDDTLQPQSPYGISKVAGESYIRISGVNHTILRFSNVYGTGSEGVINKFVQNAMENTPLVVYGDGSQTRDFIYVKDLVSALIKCIDKGNFMTLNLSTNMVTSVNGLVDIIRKHFPDIDVISTEPRVGDVEDSLMSNILAKQELGWEPKYSLESGIEDMLHELEQTV